ncbi:MAG: serine aminopeptidase domain-containing protein [Candidatus Sericytochromatia bacterium]
MLDALEARREALRAQGLAEADLPFALCQPEFRTGVLLLHGSAASPCNHRSLAQMLYGKGLTVLAPLLAGHERAATLHEGHTSWQDCYASALEALQWLEGQVDQIWVLGSSFGGTLAYLLGVDQAERLAGVIAVSAPARSSERWQPTHRWMAEVNGAIWAAEQHLDQLHLPTLVMHGSDDIHVSVKNAHFAYERLPAARKKLQLYHGIGHALGFGHNTPEMADDVARFMQFSLPPLRVDVRVPDADYGSLALAGEFNNWRADALPFWRDGDHWVCQLSLSPGVYQYKLVINGQHWILDPSADVALAPHGESNSLLRVG